MCKGLAHKPRYNHFNNRQSKVTRTFPLCDAYVLDSRHCTVGYSVVMYRCRILTWSPWCCRTFSNLKGSWANSCMCTVANNKWNFDWSLMSLEFELKSHVDKDLLGENFAINCERITVWSSIFNFHTLFRSRSPVSLQELDGQTCSSASFILLTHNSFHSLISLSTYSLRYVSFFY